MGTEEYRGEPSSTIISGLVIALDKHRKEFLMYCTKFSTFVRIQSTVEEVSPGRWLRLHVRHPYFDNQFPLNYTNCFGFDNFNVDPPTAFAFLRYFPLMADHSVGEIVVSVNVTVVANSRERRFSYECFEINPMHFVDPTDILMENHLRHGQQFIAELQASFSGWVVLRVHDNDQQVLFCDKLPNSIVPYVVSYLDETNLPSILSRASLGKRKNRVITPVKYSFKRRSSYISESEEGSPISASSPSNMPSKSNDPPTSSSACQNEKDISNVSKLEPIRYRKTSSKQFLLGDSNEIQITRGTRGLFARPNSHLDAVAINWFKEQPLDNELVTALCVVVHKYKSAIIMFSARRSVSNVLLLPSCQGIEEDLKIGDIAYFEVSKRRVLRNDSLIPYIPFSHIAVTAKPKTANRIEKIKLFEECVRTFQNLLEMKVEIDLRKPGIVEQYYDDVSLNKSESERKFYILTAGNGMQVIIPCARLQVYLDGKLTANFVLQCWAIRRKAIGSASMHIGATTEALRVYDNGKTEILPPISDFVYMG